ncbi:SLAM family member 8 [Eucyclogobius newberryi]|uniref:SLAM family member 8 n=1 Tax=Eucyclogobius newberryi TaxID=166745 RepID=UPI003B5C88DB
MLAERPICFILFFAHNALLLLGVWSHALEACLERYEGEGGTIVLSPPEPVKETLSTALWKYGEIKVADLNMDYSGNKFSGRATMDKTNYSLTVKELKITDSADFTFVSSGEAAQRLTQCIRLMVQEVLTSPTLTVINITHISNESCVVWAECVSKSVKHVSYRWTVNNANYSGARLQYSLTPPEGDITFKCSVSNNVSEASASADVNCQSPGKHDKPDKSFIGILLIVALVCATISIVVCLVFAYRRRKKRQSVSQYLSECNDELTVYAEIDDVTSEKVTSPCSLYDSVDPKPSPVRPGPKPQTVYDQIQFSRMQR